MALGPVAHRRLVDTDDRGDLVAAFFLATGRFVTAGFIMVVAVITSYSIHYTKLYD